LNNSVKNWSKIRTKP